MTVAGGSVRAEHRRRRRGSAGVRAVQLGIVAAAVATWRVDVAACALAAVVVLEVLRPRGASRWAAGAVGEEATAAVLAPLERRGYVVAHDLVAPGGRGNIDHVVVGRTGVFAVETKRWTGTVRIGRRLRDEAGRGEAAVDQALRSAAVVARLLGVDTAEVTPVLCIHGAVLRRRWWRRPVVRGVRVVDAGTLARTLARGRRICTRRQVAELARRLDDAST